MNLPEANGLGGQIAPPVAEFGIAGEQGNGLLNLLLDAIRRAQMTVYLFGATTKRFRSPKA